MSKKSSGNAHKSIRLANAAIIIAAMLALLFLARKPIMRGVGGWLDITDGKLPPHADIIYVYAGGEGERPAYAAFLYKKGLAPAVMAAGELKNDKLSTLGIDLTEGEVNKRALARFGVPADIITCVNEGSSTWDETNILHRHMLAAGLHSAILVTSNFHTRRVRMCARKIFGGSGIKLYFAAPRTAPITRLDSWWTNEEDMITVNDEYLKILYYITHYTGLTF